MGGDEFLVVLPGLDPEHAGALVERVQDAVTQAARSVVAIEGFTVSLGWAGIPRDGATPDDILAEADRRMYLDKQQRAQTSRGLALLGRAIGNPFPLTVETLSDN